jgi:hypothetical protein
MTIEFYLTSFIKQLFPQCSLGTVTLEVGRIKAGPFHSERRPSQSSQVGSCEIHQGDQFRCLVEESKDSFMQGPSGGMDTGLPPGSM